MNLNFKMIIQFLNNWALILGSFPEISVGQRSWSWQNEDLRGNGS